MTERRRRGSAGFVELLAELVGLSAELARARPAETVDRMRELVDDGMAGTSYDGAGVRSSSPASVPERCALRSARYGDAPSRDLLELVAALTASVDGHARALAILGRYPAAMPRTDPPDRILNDSCAVCGRTVTNTAHDRLRPVAAPTASPSQRRTVVACDGCRKAWARLVAAGNAPATPDGWRRWAAARHDGATYRPGAGR